MTKKEKKNLMLGFLAVLILSVIYAGILFIQRLQQSRELQKAGQELENKILLALDAEQIRQITFGSDPKVTLERSAEGFTSPEDPVFLASESRVSQMLKDLSDLEMTRRLTDISDPGQYGLEVPKNRITITMEDGEEHKLMLGNHSDSSRELYIQVDEDVSVYLTGTALDEHFSGDLNALAAYEAFPAITASRIREIEVQKEQDSFLLTTPGDDTCTVTDAEGITQQADVGLVGTLQMDLSNSSWLKNLEYHCTDLAAYGLESPEARILIKSEGTKSEGKKEKTASDAGEETAGASEYENVTTDFGEDAYEVLVLLVGSQDASGNYYVCLEGSSQVHTVRREYLESLAEGGPQSFWSRNYSFVSIGDVEYLDVTMDGVTHALRRVSETGGQTDEDLIWFVDDEEVSKESFTEFYYACVSVTAQERLAQVPEFTEEPALTLRYTLRDGTEKVLDYYPADQNFYTVVYDEGQSAANTNRLYVNAMIESYRKLLEEAGY